MTYKIASIIKRWIVISILFLNFIDPATAQDQANFTQFYLNPYILNPSYVGIDGRTSMSLIYRRQWMNIQGGPAIANFSLHTPINPKLSTGITVTNDQRGLLNNTSLLITFGYNVPVKEHSFLRFGISAGGSWNMVDLSRFDGDPSLLNDPAIASILDNNSSLAGNAGVSFHSKTFHVGISLPTIFSPSFIGKDAFTVTEIKPFQTPIIHVSNRFYFNDNKNVFEPYVLYRLNTELPSQFEAAGILHLNHMVWIGGSYKQNFGISALGGIKLQNSLAIGGSYSLKNSGENELNSPTFEVSLNFLFGQKKKNALVYSFVDTHKEKEKKVKSKSASDALAAKHKQEELAQKKKQEELAQKKKQEDALLKKKQEEQAKINAATLAKEKEEALARHRAEVKRLEEARKNEVVKAQVIPVKKDSVKTHNPRFNQALNVEFDIPEGHHEHEQEQIKRLEIHAENPTETHDETHHPHAERHEYAKKGTHKEELDVADYVIGGVFKNEANAKHFAQGLVKLGFKADFGHLTEKTLWYVYLSQTKDINEARAERDKYRKMKILRDAWLLTVHH